MIAAPPTACSPITQPHKHNQPIAEIFTRACIRVVDDGRSSRANVVRVLRMWRRESLRQGSDVTLGVAERLRAHAKVDCMELMDKNEVVFDPPEAARREFAVTEQARRAERASELVHLEAFKRAERGGAAVVMVSELGRVPSGRGRGCCVD